MMDESGDNMSCEDLKSSDSPLTVKSKPKKRSLIERELETNLTSRVTSPVSINDATSTSRYGRARRLKTEIEQADTKKVSPELKSPLSEKSPMKSQSPVYKMHASNSPRRTEQPKINGVETFLENQIESIYQENISLSRFATEDVKKTSPSPAKKYPKVYIRKDLIQKREADENVMFIKNLFSPAKSAGKSSSTHLNNILERSSERYSLGSTKQQNGFIDNSSVVKTLDFDSKKKKKDHREAKTPSKSDLFDLEAKCAYQVGDLAWARMGTYPFWPCIVTRDPSNGIFVKKKLYGRIERDVIHVTFFGDNGRRGWIADTMLRNYRGQLEFETTREGFTAEDKKKDPKLYAAFFVSEKKQALWNNSVEEAEMLLREPKRLRIDIFNDILEKSRTRAKQQKGGKISRTDSDVSLSESLYDSLFSEDDGKTDNSDRSRNRTRNKSLDVFEVVTACLDNMAAKTGITKIQRQSHMDRWLQKAKSKTPEKTQSKPQVPPVKLEAKVKSSKKRKSWSQVPVNKPYSLRHSMTESQNLLPFLNEHDYSKTVIEVTDSDHNSTDTDSCKNYVSQKANGVSNVDQNESQSNETVETEKDAESTGNENYSKVDSPKDALTKINGTCDASESENIEENSQDNSSITSTATSSGNNNTEEEQSVLNVSLNKNEEVTTSNKHEIIPDAVITRAQMISPVYEDSFDEESQDSQTMENDGSNTEYEEISARDNLENLTAESKDLLVNDDSTNVSTEPSFMSVDEDSNYKPDCSTESDTHTEDNSSLSETALTNDSIVIDNQENLFCQQNIGERPELTVNEKNNQEIDSSAGHDDIKNNGPSNLGNESNSQDVSKTNTLENNNENHVVRRCEVESSLEIYLSDNKCEENELLKHINGMEEDKTSTSFQDVRNETKNQDIAEHNIVNYESRNGNLNVKEIDMKTTKEVNIPESIPNAIQENGIHEDDSHMNGDIDLDTVSVHSEDSVTSTRSETKRKLRSKQDKTTEDPLENAEFVKYLELRQDAIMDENPELTQDEIVGYLYKTWLYEENSKSDEIKNDDLRELNLVKGINSDPVQKKKQRNVDQTKQRNSHKKNLSLNKNILQKFLHRKTRGERQIIHSDLEGDSNLEINNEIGKPLSVHQSSVGKESPISSATNSAMDEFQTRETEIALGSDTLRKPQVNNEVSDEVKDTKQTDNVASTAEQNIEQSKELSPIHPSNAVKVTFPQDVEKNNVCNDVDTESVDSEDSEAPLIRCKLRSKGKKEHLLKEDVKIKEDEADTISINSGDSEISITKRKKRFPPKKAENALDDPEFVKYLELRQDSLIDENPDLTQDEIVAYLYQTWLYEENNKSEIKKNDDIEQSGLVKGLEDVVQQPKKAKRKVKTEKETVNEIDVDVVPKDKPKRKVIKPYTYNEEFSDIEEELEVFSIFNTKVKQKDESGESAQVQVNDIDEVELYFKQLAQPKPNVFKGLIREKVCEICEVTGNLVKCKSCNGMFHVDCVNKEEVEVETPAPTRGRKKKKKLGRKPKNSDEFDNLDDKSQDVLEENTSIEEILESDAHTVDAETLEAQIAAKMKEMLETETDKVEYESYSSDDGCDWSDSVPGKCEIIDVKLKPRRSADVDLSNFKCRQCQQLGAPACAVCRAGTLARLRCTVAACGAHYHAACLEQWPQTRAGAARDAVTCPRHVCHTCVSDDPRGCRTRFSGDKLARCVRCPATYHAYTRCVPAGSRLLSASRLVCPRHVPGTQRKVPSHVNTGWCFICALGGSLICCEYCPTSFHAECLNIKPPEGGYMCEECETGRLPLYGEMVWVKLGHYRWWPAIILHPSEVPHNILAVRHSPGEFVVRFFGQYDHYWVNRGRVFPFQEGDSGRVSSQKSKIDAAFTTAMEHAQRACEILKSAAPNAEETQDIAASLLPPHYVKLKVNRPAGTLSARRQDDPEGSLTQCECSPLDEEPCGPYSQCLNRMLLTECGPTCRAGERCNNRAFEKRLYPKLVPYRTPSRGWGLKTLEDIKAGQFVIEYVGELIDYEEFRRRMSRKHELRDENFYFLTLDKERMIDAGPKGNLARFMNHCCEPNCETQKWTVLGDVRVGLFAIRDIPADSEVTFNYNLECAGIDKKRCMCGAARCSGYIGAKPQPPQPAGQHKSSHNKTKPPPAKRAYKKKKTSEESPSADTKPKRPIGRPPKPRELTEIEKDLLIIRNATNGISSDESSSSLSAEYQQQQQPSTALKRKLTSTEDLSPHHDSKRHKPELPPEVH